MVVAGGLLEFSHAAHVEQSRKTEMVHVAHGLGFRPPDLVARLVDSRRSSLC